MMRFPTAYYLLLLYSTVMIRCALPIMCDTFSHLFNEEEHIATVHAVYGSHHIETEIANTVSQNKTCGHTSSQQEEPTLVHTFTGGYRFLFNCVSSLLSHHSLPVHALPNAYALSIYQPPKGC